MRPQQIIARRLADEILCERLAAVTIVRRVGRLIGPSQRWLKSFAARIVKQFGDRRRPRRFHVERFVLGDKGFLKAWHKGLHLRHDLEREVPAMCPATGAPRDWPVPALRTKGEVARWLRLEPNELDWFADSRTQERSLPDGPLRHYHYHWISKRNGTARLIESPKRRLKAIQRRILCEVLNPIPPHPAVHGFRTGRSIKTSAALHTGRHIVLKMDLRNFFPGIFRARIMAIFMTAGYPEAVAQVLARLGTNSVPAAVFLNYPGDADIPERRRMKLLFRQPHLPQGAPTSPALANLAAFRFDSRVAGLARAVGAEYTRYADDLVFSGDGLFATRVDRFQISVGAIALEEGFEVNARKTRIMRRSVAQRALGLVLNSHLNVSRGDFDRLKAILHNCVKHGPAGQNREGVPTFHAHLSGRIAHVEAINPSRGSKLRAVFQRIDWSSADNPAD